MCTECRQISLGFTSGTFPAGTHMCYIYNDDEERRRIMSGFVASSLPEGERVIYGGYSSTGTSLEAMLGKRDATALGERPEQFEILEARKTYCPDGRFVPERMLERVRALYTTSLEKGFAGARATAEMEWALENIPGADRLVEYEALLNTITARHPITMVCQYDARRFDGALLFEVLTVHPAMIVHGQVVRNPYYVPPDHYLKKRPVI
jgi:hypothetical protein